MTPKERAILLSVLTYHWPTRNNGCTCGWAELGRSFPNHQVEVYEQAVEADLVPPS